MHKKITLPFILLALVLVSCATENEAVREVPEYNEAMVNKLEVLLEQGQQEAVLQLCSLIDDERVKNLAARAFNELEVKYETAETKADYRDAAEYLKSLLATGFETNQTPEDIYLHEALKLIQNDEITLGLAVFQNRIINRPDGTSLENEQIDIIAGASLSNGNKVVLKYLLNKFPEHEFKDTEKVKELLEYVPTKEMLISGTVTIWVDRGIKLERGLGYPDRVIGSGFYIDKRGYILTNYHVISSEVDPEYEGFSRLYVKYSDNEEKLPAEVIGWDASLDIALLKVFYTPEYIYNFPEKREYRPGEKIYAIGSPGGLDKTITSGIVSASGNRRLLPLGDTIQVDVPINAGNSGGPLLDADGNFIGVVFAGIEQFEGVNFVIPAEWIINSLPELYQKGRNTQSWLGLTIHESRDGIEIIYVMPGTSAFKTSLSSGDMITEIDGVPVSGITECQSIIQRKRPGTLLNLTVEKQGVEKKVLLQVEDREDRPMEKALVLDSKKNLLAPFLGMTVDKASDDVIGQEYIIRKVYRGMPADETGLSANDPFSIITWEIEKENHILIVGVRIKKRKAGFLETVIQLGNYIDINNTI